MLRFAPALESNAPLKVLCLGAHSDDIEIGCGGTILRLLAEHPNSEVTWVVMSAQGEREQEARRSAAAYLAGAKVATVDIQSFKESYFPFVGSSIKDFFETLKRGNTPDLILTHRRDDEHQDHRVVAQFTWNTFRDHCILEYEIPKYEGDLGHPNLFVPLPAAIAARKVALLLEHFKTQANRQWFRAETFNAVMTLRGIECIAPEAFAEAFYVRKFVL